MRPTERSGITGRKIQYIIVFIALLVAFIYLIYVLQLFKNINYPSEEITSESSLIHEAKIVLGQKEVFVQLADTPQEITRGLSGKKFISDDEGMLFVFKNKSYPVFWMIDMNFGLDIIWISDSSIVQIDHSVAAPSTGQTDDDLRLYTPYEPVNYVLEVNSGFSEKHGINKGDKVDIIGLE